jgi:Nucleotidyltransferase domain
LVTKNEYYFLSTNNESCIDDRIANTKRANEAEQKVKRFSTLISKFPYVKGVCISGSYSKNSLLPKGDIDYFIICKPNRLWLSRTLLILYKKIVLLDSEKYFCVNYFIDTDTLTIPDKNSYTATEVATLIPVNNIELFNQFLKANAWVYDEFPNFKETRNAALIKEKNSKLALLIEKLCNGKLGDKLDTYFFNLTIKTWKKRFPVFDDTHFDLNMRSRKNASKHHPRGFQTKVLTEIETRFNRVISSLEKETVNRS